jgi:hypothetical protein
MLPSKTIRRWTLWLTVAAFLLPIALCVISAVASLLVGMGDTSGGGVLCRIALAGGILWATDLICLLLVLAVKALGDGQGAKEADEETKDL